MGQINCQCQYLPQEELPRSQATLAQDEQITARTAVYVQLTLRGKSGIIEVRLRQATPATLGTSEDAHQRAPPQPAPGFKLHLRLAGRNVYGKDTGFGLGCFLLKRKLTLPADNSETLLAIDDQFLLLRIRPNEQTQLTLISPDREETRQLERRNEHQIQLDGSKLILRREREGREYSVRRADRGVVWVLLGEERRIKLHDMLRLGSEYYAVQGSTSYIESSKVVHRY